MLLSDWLSHYTLSAISVQWFGIIHKIATFHRFSEVKILEKPPVFLNKLVIGRTQPQMLN